ncbi:uncharacterized protein LOC135937693 [Cloeon dipterum]|uniref:uncharacterized protein LOC135937693 n=1 Tax=Cloeon dipterum TaxID=197152 RepID=UPI0032200D6C
MRVAVSSSRCWIGRAPKTTINRRQCGLRRSANSRFTLKLEQPTGDQAVVLMRRAKPTDRYGLSTRSPSPSCSAKLSSLWQRQSDSYNQKKDDYRVGDTLELSTTLNAGESGSAWLSDLQLSFRSGRLEGSEG